LEFSALVVLVSEIVGGLGLFLLGMKNMSEGMQAVAGSSLRRMIGTVTNNRLLATTVGTVVTCVVQSSSVTTVMVVGLVNSGVMELAQAIGVIMGANIGTTITGWMLVLKIGKYGLPMLGMAAFVYLFTKGDRWRYWAMAIMGVGMVFFGLELMKDACSIIKEMPDFEAWFQRFRADSYIGVLKCALAGCLLTMLVQSSSATLGITISLAYQGVISYETAAALVLGENIGTTVTAFLASLGATTVARRAAYFHVIFNMIGVFWITLIFPWYIQFVQFVIDGEVATAVVALEDGVELRLTPESDVLVRDKDDIIMTRLNADGDPVDEEGNIIDDDGLRRYGVTINDEWNVYNEEGEQLVSTFPDTTPAIAATHSIFNITNTVLFLPFLPLFVQLLNRIVPAREFKEKPHLQDLDIRILETPTLAIEQSRREIEKMGDGCAKMLDWLADLMQQDHPDKALADRLKQREQVLDSIQDEVSEFVTNLLSGNIPHAVADEARLQLRMTDEYESVSDYIANLDKFDRKLRRDGHRFTEEQRAGLYELNRHIAEYLAVINEALRQGNRHVLTKTEPMAKRIRAEIKRLRRKHLDDLSGGAIAPPVSVAYLAALNAYARVRDHSHNIAEAVSGEK
jgi:phosphate:Na+ symporter